MNDDDPITKVEIRAALVETATVDPVLAGVEILDFAEQREAVDLTLRPYVDRIVAAFDVASAWVSDESNMGDFILIPSSSPAFATRILEVMHRLGILFAKDERVVDVARRLRERDTN